MDPFTLATFLPTHHGSVLLCTFVTFVSSCRVISITVADELDSSVTGMVFNFGGLNLGKTVCEDFFLNNGLSVAALDAVILKPVSKHDQIAMSGQV